MEPPLSVQVVRLTCLAISLICGTLAFYLVRAASPPEREAAVRRAEPSTFVLIATRNLPVGTVAAAELFRWQAWPSNDLPSNYITTNRPSAEANRVTGMIVGSEIHAGEPLTAAKLLQPREGGTLATLLPADKLAISVPIESLTPGGRLIEPHDRVDMILTRRPSRTTLPREIESVTILRNVRVIAIGNEVGASEPPRSKGDALVTIEVTSAQAELVAAAKNMGRLSLALRSAFSKTSSEQSDIYRLLESKNIELIQYGTPKHVPAL